VALQARRAVEYASLGLDVGAAALLPQRCEEGQGGQWCDEKTKDMNKVVIFAGRGGLERRAQFRATGLAPFHKVGEMVAADAILLVSELLYKVAAAAVIVAYFPNLLL
jgi:chloramphenicol 3-O-phosphotransferase